MKKIVLLAAMAASFIPMAGAQERLKGKILKIDAGDIVSERGGSNLSISLLGGISSSSSISLLDAERALEKAATDDKIAMVYLNTDHFTAGTAATEELRHLLRQVSEAGKPVVAYGASMDNSSYYLASAADKIFLHPGGGGSLTGLSTTQLFVKDLLDTLGIEVQLIRHGKYKSAGEMYIRSDISPENREQYEVLLGSLWETICSEIGDSRGIPADSLRAWADNLALGTAVTWTEKGLVDGLKHRDEMESYLTGLFGVNSASLVRRVTLRDYASSLKKGHGKKVAVIYANGEIVRSGSGVAGESLARTIAKVRADSSVKAVVFRVNSPGGEVVAAEMIRREIELLGRAKPVVASYGAYAASGGYLISAGCRQIFTDNTTLTGSIGVFGMVPSFGKAIRTKLHVNPVTIGTGVHSGLGGGIEPLDESELEWYQSEIELIYDSFVATVAEGRGMTTEEVDALAQGRVWSGKDAIEAGLADEIGTVLDAVNLAARIAGLEKWKLVTYPEKKSLMAQLRGDSDSGGSPLVIARKLLHPGLNVIARVPYLSLDQELDLIVSQ